MFSPSHLAPLTTRPGPGPRTVETGRKQRTKTGWYRCIYSNHPDAARIEQVRRRRLLLEEEDGISSISILHVQALTHLHLHLTAILRLQPSLIDASLRFVLSRHVSIKPHDLGACALRLTETPRLGVSTRKIIGTTAPRSCPLFHL
jgi:hypothetical protein